MSEHFMCTSCLKRKISCAHFSYEDTVPLFADLVPEDSCSYCFEQFGCLAFSS